MIYSKALAYRELGQPADAAAIFKEMISDGNRALTTRLHPAWYMTSVARRYNRQRNEARACLRIALGYLGQGNKSQAASYFQKARELDEAMGYALIFN